MEPTGERDQPALQRLLTLCSNISEDAYYSPELYRETLRHISAVLTQRDELWDEAMELEVCAIDWDKPEETITKIAKLASKSIEYTPLIDLIKKQIGDFHDQYKTQSMLEIIKGLSTLGRVEKLAALAILEVVGPYSEWQPDFIKNLVELRRDPDPIISSQARRIWVFCEM